jgi:Hint domain
VEIKTFSGRDGRTYVVFRAQNGAFHAFVKREKTDLRQHRPPPQTTCFMRGTMISTPSGARPVETLERGDLISTVDGRALPVTWVDHQTVSTRFADPIRVLPIRIKASALRENMPSCDLLLSADHAILVDDVLIQAGALVNGSSVVRETNVPETFTCYHSASRSVG